MSWSEKTNTPFHLQSDPDWCGPASVMMAAAQLNIPYPQIRQGDLYSKIRENNCSPPNSRWRSDPCGVVAALSALPAPLATRGWHLYLRDSVRLATRDIFFSIRTHKRPAVALVFRGEHWVVIDRVSANVDPAGANFFQVNALWLHNPAPDGRTPPQVHKAKDDCSKVPYPDELSWDEWYREYLLADSDDIWGQEFRFIVVADSDNRGSFGSPANPIGDVGLPDIGKSRAKGKAEVFLSGNDWGSYFEAAERVSGSIASDALRIERLNKDGEERTFYLVPFVKDGQVVASVKLDRAGNFRSLRVHLGEFLLPGPALRSLTVASTFGVQPSHSEDLGSSFVWRPCQESRSPHLPFWKVSIAGATKWIRFDGAVFSGLTDLRKGA